ncbi:flagellar protein FliT [Halobacillus sp. A1]|uniref:flagellar protein FliT n=1 Tax=Halobacillus sp. A1 TaxID=2880262 RepID=UPI0020A64B84|nr:flagellar protein FliT [Halobacillus sp. A1]MCP3031422.1 flagellar protein FliT [Halobacillus sp. A1]
MGWQHFLTITELLSKEVNRKVTDDNRQEVVQEIQRLLGERSAIIQQLPQPQTNKEKEIVQTVMSLDLDINQKLEFLFNGLKVELRQMRRQKSSTQRYMNPYQSVSSFDGMFMDRKK